LQDASLGGFIILGTHSGQRFNIILRKYRRGEEYVE
jgi:hypothetical protein